MNAVRLRELEPDDGDVLDAVFAGLSAQSRYLRFHSPVTRAGHHRPAQSTALDGRHHVAFGAFAGGRPIGISRIVALGAGRAELAVEVVDGWHGHGVGTRLVQAARDRAAELGYRELVAEVLAENSAMQAVLRRVFPIARTVASRRRSTITVPVTDFDLSALIDGLAA